MLTGTLSALWRRRIPVAGALVLSIALTVATFLYITPSSQYNAQVLFLGPSKEPGVVDPTNPFLGLTDSLAVIASVVQVQVTDEATGGDLAREGAVAAYTVEPDLAENAGPILLVTASDKSAATAQKTVSAVVDEIRTTLTKLQSDRHVDPDLYVTTQTLSSSLRPQIVRKTQLEESVIAALASLVVLLGAILLVDRRSLAARTAAEREALRDSDESDLRIARLAPREALSRADADGDPDDVRVQRRGRRAAGVPRTAGIRR